jgi:3-(3-hydroxy-phenyl)propionate hydroxylase
MTVVNKSPNKNKGPLYDLIIIGLGPVGSTAAILMAEAGLKVVVIETDSEVYQLPRAVNLDSEIIRAFQAISRGNAVDHLMQKVRPGERAGFANSKHEWLFGQESSDFGPNGWQPMNMFDQPEFEGYLRDEALAHPNVTAFIGYTALEVTDRSDDVAVLIAANESGEQTELLGRYALGTDGAASFVRKSIGSGWQNLGYDADWLVVDVTVKPGHTLGVDTLQVCDPDRITTYVCTKDPYRRWEFKLLPGETAEQMLVNDRIHGLIDAWTPRATYEIRRAAVYQFHAATAEKWRQGKIFIGGDAAHQTPPFLGQGMNAGMRDAINLAWKLPLVIRGLCDPQILDSYEAERSAHALDLVEWAVSIGKLMDHTAEVERAQRDGKTAPEMPTVLKSSGYGQGRGNPPIRDGIVMIDQVSDTGSTGYLFAQPEVSNADGAISKLDDILGNGFALVTKSSKALLLSQQTLSILDRLAIKVVSLEGLSVVRGRTDRLFEHHNVAIVRPDRLVFGHTDDSITVDDLVTNLESKMSLTTISMH